MKYQNISICHESHLTVCPLTSKTSIFLCGKQNKYIYILPNLRVTYKKHFIQSQNTQEISHYMKLKCKFPKAMLSQIACNTQHVTNKTRMLLAHWHTLPISHLHHISNIFHKSTFHHRNISMLSTDNRVTMQHIKHANKFLEQLNNTEKVNKYNTGSHPDPSIGSTDHNNF